MFGSVFLLDVIVISSLFEKTLNSVSLCLIALRLAGGGDDQSGGWRFYFKLYCFTDTENIAMDSVEFAFMFEQVGFYTT